MKQCKVLGLEAARIQQRNCQCVAERHLGVIVGGLDDALARMRSNLNVLARDGAIIGGQDIVWPEKDKESISADNGRWLRWKPVDPEKPEGKVSVEFARKLLFSAVRPNFKDLEQELRGKKPAG